MPDLASTENYGIKLLSGFVQEGGEKLLHPDRGAAAVDISSKRQKVFRLQHLNRLFMRAHGCLFQVELAVHRNHVNIVRARLCNGYKRFKHPIVLDAQNVRRVRAGGDILAVK